MKIYIGGDHRGYAFKGKVKKLLERDGYTVVDVGTHDATKMCDYPRLAYKVGSQVVKSKNNRGILICMTGLGQAIAANKVRGAYATLCYNATSAAFARKHNNANILVLAAKFIKAKDLGRIIRTFLKTDFEGGRHQRRVNLIKKMEKGQKLK